MAHRLAYWSNIKLADPAESYNTMKGQVKCFFWTKGIKVNKIMDIMFNLLVIPSFANPFSGIDLTTSSEFAERQIQTIEISIFKITENISVIHQNKA